MGLGGRSGGMRVCRWMGEGWGLKVIYGSGVLVWEKHGFELGGFHLA